MIVLVLIFVILFFNIALTFITFFSFALVVSAVLTCKFPYFEVLDWNLFLSI
jgi:hypothetical protein